MATHPAISPVAVFPVAADGNDEEVGAVVVKRAGASVDEIELMRHCEANMSYFMIPCYIESGHRF